MKCACGTTIENWHGVSAQCFSCDFWDDVAKNPTTLVIDGVAYNPGKATTPDRWNGFGGQWFTIHKGWNVIRTCDLWHRGTVPETHRARMPNNAEFVR